MDAFETLETVPDLHILASECFLIRKALSLEDQVELCAYIKSIDTTPEKTGPRPISQGPKTLTLGEDGHPMRRYMFGDDSVVNRIINKTSAWLEDQGAGILNRFKFASGARAWAAQPTRKGAETSAAQQSVEDVGTSTASRYFERDICNYRAISMATIRYEAPNGQFKPHVDHCNDSLVFLISLGRTANFMVKGYDFNDPEVQSAVQRFKFTSGDVLIFNASTGANLLHGVDSVDETASEHGEALAQEFPMLQTHRYGVQCRIYF